MKPTPTRTPIRKVAPYQAPGLFGDDDRGPKLDLPSQARPPSAPERAHRLGFLRITVDRVVHELRSEDDRHQPGIGADRRRIFDFHQVGGYDVEARVSTYPTGPRCTCKAFTWWQDCGHVAALIEAGYIPNVRLAGAALETWTVTGEVEGG